MPIQYSIVVKPVAALIGESIMAELRCVAGADVASALTFDHRSLVIELDRDGLPEPAVAFPNRYAVQGRSGLVRLSSPGGVEHLAAGEERARRFDLDVLFPDLVLSVGKFSVTYRLEEAEPPVRPAPFVVDVASGPGAVAHLMERLRADSIDVRSRAAELLLLMTAQDFGYDADAPVDTQINAIVRWQTWWRDEGSRLPWSFETEGATFGGATAEAPASARSPRLGGVAYPHAHD